MLIRFAIGMLAIAGMLAVLVTAFVGIGLAARRRFVATMPSLDDCFLAFWVGYGAVLLFLIAWSFVSRIGLAALLIVLAAGLTSAFRSRHDLRNAFTAPAWLPDRWEVSILALAGFWVVNHAIEAFQSWDGVLYHVQAVKWAKAYTVVPGLANLHGPLAFNNSSFLYDAMVDSGWWEGRGFHIANAALLLVAVLQAAVNGMQWRRGRSSSARCFAFVMVALALHSARDVASYSTDLPVALVLGAAITLIYSMLNTTGAGTRHTGSYEIVALAALLAASVSIKLNAVAFAASAVPIVAFLWFRDHTVREAATKRALVWASVVIVGFAVAWTARGVVMSGYPFFPIAVAELPVDWRASAEHANLETAYIAHTERAFTWRLIGSNWLRLIFVNDVNAAFVPAALAAIAFVTWWRLRSRSAASGAVPQTWWLSVPLLVAIGVWFVTVPSHRYSPVLFWSMAALCIAESQRVLSAIGKDGGRRWAAAIVVACIASPLILEPALAPIRRGRNPLPAIAEHNIVLPASDEALPSLEGNVSVTIFETHSGLALNTPTRATLPGGMPNACWDAPLPCTPNPAPNLELRVPGDLGQGFRVNGAWTMLDWPYYWHAYFLPEFRARRSHTE